MHSAQKKMAATAAALRRESPVSPTLCCAVSIEKYAVKSVCGPGKEQQYQASIFPHNIIKRHVRRGHFEYDQFVYDCKR